MSNNSVNTTKALQIPHTASNGSASCGISTSSFGPLVPSKLLSSTTTSSTSANSASTSPSSSSSMIDEYYLSFLPKMSFDLPDVDLITDQINALFVQKVDSLLVQNTRVLLLGATLGAAVSAGVFLGIASAGFLFAAPSTSSTSFKVRYQFLRRKIWDRWFGKNRLNNVQRHDDDDDFQLGNKINHESEHMHGNEHKTSDSKNDIVFIQGNPIIEKRQLNDTEEVILERQFRSCLDSITSSLQVKNLGWKDVRQLSAKLVATNHNKQNAELLRKIIKEYQLDENQDEATISSIVFVIGLEDPASFIQIEVMAI